MNSDELRGAKVKLNFDYKYKELGGLVALLNMVDKGEPIKDIAERFGITKTRVHVILRDILGMPYGEYRVLRKYDKATTL